jgi:RNA polymerase sigma-70 factor, ECF subfamily
VAAHDEFSALDEFRAELLVHCYRMLGSAEEAEDVVQETVTASRAGVRLAMVAALQYLPARQRAVLILRDVLNWPAAEVADLLGTTTTAVNSGLRRARAQIARALPAEEEVAEPAEPDRRALLDRFAAAFEDGDVTALAALLREDVALEMPPLATWFSGREAVLGYVASNLGGTAGRMRLRPAAANGQPAFAAYLRDADGVYRAHAMIVLTLTGSLITRIVIFLEPALFRLFGLARELAPGESGDRRCSTSPRPPTAAAVEQAGEDGNVNRERAAGCEQSRRPPGDGGDADPGVDRGLCHVP